MACFVSLSRYLLYLWSSLRRLGIRANLTFIFSILCDMLFFFALQTSCVCVCACVKRFSRCTTMKTLLQTRSSGYLFSIHLFRCQALLIVGYWSQMLASNKCEKKTTSDKRKLTHRNAGYIFICHNNIGAVRSSMFDIFHVRHSHVDRIQIQYCNMGISIVFWYIDSICENSSQYQKTWELILFHF